LKIERIYRFIDNYARHDLVVLYEESPKENDLWVDIDIRDTNVFDVAVRKTHHKYKTFSHKNSAYFNERIRDTNKNSKKIQKYFNENTCDYFRMSNYCCGIMKNGDFCGCSAHMSYEIDRDYYHKNINFLYFDDDGCWKRRSGSKRDRFKTELKFCRKHHKQITYMNHSAQDEYVDKIYRKFGYELKHGILCKVCK